MHPTTPSSTGAGWPERIARVLADGGPEMVFQPVVDLWTGEVRAYEALARFPEGSPLEWFVAAHACGPAVYLALEAAAVRNALSWLPSVPAPMALAVNVCEHAVYERYALGMPPLADTDLSRLIVEITEHYQIGDYPRLVRELEPLRTGGVRVAVDDLGVGSATFRHVLALHPDVVKLDRSLVTGCHLREAEDQRALLAAMALFCARSGIRLVCEGVETEAEAAVLRAVGVPYGQGWLYGRPGPLPTA